MKKLVSLFLLATAICHSLHAATTSNPRNALITAIARNDFGTVTQALEELATMSADDKEEFLEFADQMIINSVEWYNKHHDQPEIGKDYIAAFGYYIATLVSASGTALFCELINNTMKQRANPERYGHLGNYPALKYTIPCTAILAGITTYFGYKTIQKVICAWMKPSNRLENALRIKDAILQYPSA